MLFKHRSMSSYYHTLDELIDMYANSDICEICSFGDFIAVQWEEITSGIVEWDGGGVGIFIGSMNSDDSINVVNTDGGVFTIPYYRLGHGVEIYPHGS